MFSYSPTCCHLYFVVPSSVGCCRSCRLMCKSAPSRFGARVESGLLSLPVLRPRLYLLILLPHGVSPSRPVSGRSPRGAVDLSVDEAARRGGVGGGAHVRCVVKGRVSRTMILRGRRTRDCQRRLAFWCVNWRRCWLLVCGL
jgi:hypothetical protein